MSTLLKAQGHDVISTEKSDEAAEIIKSDQVLDMMISDIRMNPINGMELLKLARKLRPEMPVMMVTAYDSEETAQEAMNLGAFGYLAKPFKTQELLGKVKTATEQTA